MVGTGTVRYNITHYGTYQYLRSKVSTVYLQTPTVRHPVFGKQIFSTIYFDNPLCKFSEIRRMSKFRICVTMKPSVGNFYPCEDILEKKMSKS